MACDTLPIVSGSEVYISGRMMDSEMSKWFLIAGYNTVTKCWMDPDISVDDIGCTLWDSCYEDRTVLTVTHRINERNRKLIGPEQLSRVISARSKSLGIPHQCPMSIINGARTRRVIDVVQSGHWAVVQVKLSDEYWWMLVPTMLLSHIDNNEDMNVSHAEAHKSVSQLAHIRSIMIDQILAGADSNVIVVRNCSRPVYRFSQRYSYYPITHIGSQCDVKYVDVLSIAYANRSVCYDFTTLIGHKWCESGHVWGYLHAQYKLVSPKTGEFTGVLLGANKAHTIWMTMDGVVGTISHADVKNGTVQIVGDDNNRTGISNGFTVRSLSNDQIELAWNTTAKFFNAGYTDWSSDLLLPKMTRQPDDNNDPHCEPGEDPYYGKVKRSLEAKKVARKSKRPDPVIDIPVAQEPVIEPIQQTPFMDQQMVIMMMFAKMMRKRNKQQEGST